MPPPLWAFNSEAKLQYPVTRLSHHADTSLHAPEVPGEYFCLHLSNLLETSTDDGVPLLAFVGALPPETEFEAFPLALRETSWKEKAIQLQLN